MPCTPSHVLLPSQVRSIDTRLLSRTKRPGAHAMLKPFPSCACNSRTWPSPAAPRRSSSTPTRARTARRRGILARTGRRVPPIPRTATPNCSPALATTLLLRSTTCATPAVPRQHHPRTRPSRRHVRPEADVAFLAFAVRARSTATATASVYLVFACIAGAACFFIFCRAGHGSLLPVLFWHAGPQ